MEKFLILLSGPLCLLDGGIKPLEPAGLALFGRLAMDERSNSGPLVLAVLHDGRLEDLILRVAPHAALYHHARHLE